MTNQSDTQESVVEQVENSHPEVTIHLPTFNRPEELSRCLNSIQAQTYKYFRVEIFDNGSNPPATLEPHILSDSRYSIHRISENSLRHEYALRKLKEVKTEFFAFMFDDDQWEPEKLQIQVDCLTENPDVVACFTHASIIDDNGNYYNNPPRPYPYIFNVENRSRAQWVKHFFTYSNCLCQPSALIRTNAIISSLHQLPLRQLWDFATWVQLLALGNLHIIKKPLTKYRVSAEGKNESHMNHHSYNRLIYETSRILHLFTKLPDDLLQESFLNSSNDSGMHIEREHIDRAIYEYSTRIGSPAHFRFAAELAEAKYQIYTISTDDERASEWYQRSWEAASEINNTPKPNQRNISNTKPNDESISFIICSINDEKFSYIRSRLSSICNISHEVIRISDASGLSEAYNRGIRSAKHDIIVLCHDDIDFLCDVGFSRILLNALSEFDLVGVAGPRILKSSFWLGGGPTNSAGLVIHGPVGKHNASYSINYYDSEDTPLISVQAIDGVFMAARRSTFSSISFDEAIFDGFHFYDIDFSHRCHLAGYRVGICKDLLLVHSSGGNFGEDWNSYERIFRNKFPYVQAAVFQPRFLPATIFAQTLKEAATYCRNTRVLDYIASAKPNRHNVEYEKWRKFNELSEFDVQTLAYSMINSWTDQPSFHIFTEVNESDIHLVSETIESLSEQLYKSWVITVISKVARPTTTTGLPNLQWLSLIDLQHSNYVIQEISKQTNCDWIIKIPPGTLLEPHALLTFSDFANSSPNSVIIYSDRDKAWPDGYFSNPNFCPGPDIFLLKHLDYINSATAIRKDSLVASLEQDLSLSDTHSIYLDVFKRYGVGRVLHVNDILFHIPAPANHLNTSQEAQSSSEKDINSFQEHANDGRPDVENGPHLSILYYLTHSFDIYLENLVSFLQVTNRVRIELFIVIKNLNDSFEASKVVELVDIPSFSNVTVINHAFSGDLFEIIRSFSAKATGDYLLFLEDCELPASFQWLNSILVLAVLPEIGCVQPSLLKNNRLCRRGYSPSLLFESVDFEHYELQPSCVDQHILAAVDFRALLSKKSLLEDFFLQNSFFFGRYLSIAFSRYLENLELAVVLQPTVALKTTALSLPNLLKASSEELSYLKENLPWITSSHNYNSNLSYSHPCSLDLNRFVSWNRTIDLSPKILFISSSSYFNSFGTPAISGSLLIDPCSPSSHWQLDHGFDITTTVFEISRAKPTSIVFISESNIELSTLILYCRSLLNDTELILFDPDGIALVDKNTHVPSTSGASTYSYLAGYNLADHFFSSINSLSSYLAKLHVPFEMQASKEDLQNLPAGIGSAVLKSRNK